MIRNGQFQILVNSGDKLDISIRKLAMCRVKYGQEMYIPLPSLVLLGYLDLDHEYVACCRWCRSRYVYILLRAFWENQGNFSIGLSLNKVDPTPSNLADLILLELMRVHSTHAVLQDRSTNVTLPSRMSCLVVFVLRLLHCRWLGWGGGLLVKVTLYSKCKLSQLLLFLN